ncbi:MAG: tetratricopeptide repeat protein [Ignavibacteria bacterium]|nr:tetratricopeptide repeat protein [Ignavibacteria bacterium]
MGKICLFAILLLCLLNKTYSQDLKPEELFEKYQDAIVVVYSYDFDNNPKAQGSGVIINDRGWVITNFHIFEGCQRMDLVHKGDTIKYTDIIGVDIEKDLVIMKIESGTFPDIKLSEKDPKVGQKVYAIGSPMGLENSMSEGIVSGNRTEVGKKKQNFVQITASLSPGSSGGAVLNSYGELIGISSMGLREGNNLNFAIPVSDILKVKLDSYNDKKKIEALNFFYQGQNLFEEGKNEDAIKYYTKFLEMFPKDHKAFNYRGMAYFARKQFEKAISDYNSAIKLDPTFSAAYNNRGEAYFKMKEYELSIKDFSYVIKSNPANMDAYFGRGVVYMSDESYEDALDDFKRVIKEDPQNTSALVNMGICEYYKKRYEMAIEYWKTAIKHKPGLKGELQPLIDQADILWQYNIK